MAESKKNYGISVLAEYITVCNETQKADRFKVYADGFTKLNKNKADLKIEEAADGFTYVHMGKKKYPVDIIEKFQNHYHVVINGISYNFSIETPISYQRKKFLEKNLPASKTEVIDAPMPGKIIDVIVDENSDVAEHDAIIILEAMKMQNEILSPVAGKIKKIYVRPGDNVMKDDPLIEIEK